MRRVQPVSDQTHRFPNTELARDDGVLDVDNRHVDANIQPDLICPGPHLTRSSTTRDPMTIKLERALHLGAAQP
jgi:hypothetical protein